MSEFTTILNIDTNSVFGQITSSNEYHALPPFSFDLAHQEMQEMIHDAGAEDDCGRIYDSAVMTARLRELDFECRYLNRECQIYAPLHFIGPSDDYTPSEELTTATGMIIATPQCFSFIKDPLEDRVIPCLISLSLVYTAHVKKPEVIELFTPLDKILITPHTPALN